MSPVQVTLATLEAARAKHLASITPVPDQNGRGSSNVYALCADPDSQSKYPAYPNCTLNTSTWIPTDVCHSSRCLEANPSFASLCGGHDRPVPLCVGSPPLRLCRWHVAAQPYSSRYACVTPLAQVRHGGLLS